MTQPDTAGPAELRLQVAVDQLIQPEHVFAYLHLLMPVRIPDPGSGR